MAGRLRWEGFGDADDRWTGRQPVDDECARADLAFVQLPEAVLQVVCTPAMEFHAFNAICQLVAWAKAGGYGRLVIAFPYETWLGSHDGRSWFERAIDACVQSAHADPSLAVGVVLPAGNGSNRRGHATPVQEGGDGRRLGLELSLAASSELPTWMELWLPGHWDLSHLSLEAKAPGAQQFHPLGLLSEDTLNPVGGLRVVVERALPVRQQNAPFRRRLLNDAVDFRLMFAL